MCARCGTDPVEGARFCHRCGLGFGAGAMIAGGTGHEAANVQTWRPEWYLHTVFDALPHWILVKNLEGTVVHVNQAFAKAHGLPAEEFRGMSPDNPALGKQDDPKRWFAQDAEVIKTRTTMNWSGVQVELPNGATSIRDIFKAPLFDDQGELVGVVAISIDISEGRRTRAELSRNEALLRAIIDHSPMPIYLKDLEGRFVMVNRQLLLNRNLGEEDIIGKTGKEFVESEYADITKAMDEEVMASSRSVSREVDWKEGDGRLCKIIFTKFPLLGEKNEITHIGTIATDVTEQRKIEEHLHESSRLEALRRLTGGISHEFNNAMQVILNSAELIRLRKNDPVMIDEFSGAIERHAKRTADLTRQLLTFSKQRAAALRPLSLGGLILRLQNTLPSMLGQGIDVTSGPMEELYPVMGDSPMLEQAILNLCLNSSDAMPNGGVIHLMARNVEVDADQCAAKGWEQPGSYAMISLKDSGVGIDPENLEHIFEPFFTTKSVGEGPGLGLSVVYTTIRQHGGMIDVESTPGEGTTVHIYLPKAIDEQPAEATVQERTPTPTLATSPTVLVAEDEPDVLELLVNLLEDQNYRVIPAKNGREGLEQFHANRNEIDLVILDMVMPEMTGRELFEKIRSEGSNVSVLFSSGLSPDSGDMDFLAQEDLRLIQKPYSPKTLYSAVQEALKSGV